MKCWLAAATVGLIVGCSEVDPEKAPSPPRVPPGSWHVSVFGDGTPPVVFEGDIGAPGRDWLPTARHVAEETRVIVYDRLGLGESGPPQQGDLRDAAAAADELRDMLDATGVEGPYVFVAQGYGSVIVRDLHAETPHWLAAAVFVNPWHAEQFEVMADFRAYLEKHEVKSEGAEEELRAAAGSLRAVRESGRYFGHRPLVVVTGTDAPAAWSGGSERLPETRVQWRAFQEEIAGLSSHSVHTYVEGGYELPSEQPDLLAKAVLHAVEAVRADDD